MCLGTSQITPQPQILPSSQQVVSAISPVTHQLLAPQHIVVPSQTYQSIQASYEHRLKQFEIENQNLQEQIQTLQRAQDCNQAVSLEHSFMGKGGEEKNSGDASQLSIEKLVKKMHKLEEQDKNREEMLNDFREKYILIQRQLELDQEVQNKSLAALKAENLDLAEKNQKLAAQLQQLPGAQEEVTRLQQMLSDLQQQHELLLEQSEQVRAEEGQDEDVGLA